jgi:hypothetical protein
MAKSKRRSKTMAQRHGVAAIKELAKIAGLVNGGKGKAESEQVRIAALIGILDCAYGEAPQPYIGEGGEGPIQLQELLSVVNSKTRGIFQITQR